MKKSSTNNEQIILKTLKDFTGRDFKTCSESLEQYSFECEDYRVDEYDYYCFELVELSRNMDTGAMDERIVKIGNSLADICNAIIDSDNEFFRVKDDIQFFTDSEEFFNKIIK